MTPKLIYLQNTNLFKDWLNKKGYSWVDNPCEQENLVAEFRRDLLEEGKDE